LILKVIPVNYNGTLDLDYFNSILSSRTRLVSISHISNVFGIIIPITKLIKKAHEFGAFVCIDGAQAISHIRVNVKELDVDFYTFSAHKIFGPTGVGVLYGKKNILNRLYPWQGGGGMIKKVNIYKTVYEELPYRFEVGTPNISGIVSFKSGIELINQIGLDEIYNYEKHLIEYIIHKLSNIPNIILYHKYVQRASIISFNIQNIHSFDVGSILSKMGIFIRTGHHCAQPLINTLGVTGTIRISCSIYNTYEDVDYLYNGLLKVINLL
jgi:cysteine desulfurase / selenocysteine lyase